MKNTFNTLEAIQAQKKYCEEKDYPHFAAIDAIKSFTNKLDGRLKAA